MRRLRLLVLSLALFGVLAGGTQSSAGATTNRLGQPYGGKPVTVPFPTCGDPIDRCPNPYLVSSASGTIPNHDVNVTFRNRGPAIPHLIVRLDSFGTYVVTNTWARLTVNGRHTQIAPRRLRTIVYTFPKAAHLHERAADIWVYEFGRIPVGAKIYIEADARFPGGQDGEVLDSIVAYGRFNTRGLPDASTVVNGGSSLSWGTG